jgi:hypothetical protein
MIPPTTPAPTFLPPLVPQNTLYNNSPFAVVQCHDPTHNSSSLERHDIKMKKMWYTRQCRAVSASIGGVILQWRLV